MESDLSLLEEQVQGLSTGPGVYLMKDKEGNVLYVGKAKNLRNRVRNYFDRSGDTRYTLQFLRPKIHRLETLLTDTEKEALILENTLIKKFKPRYNINFKDDKTYFSLKFNVGAPFPRLSLVRQIKRDGSRFFGPFASGAAVKETLKLLHRLFPLRTCKDVNFQNRSRPCLNFQIRKCLGPCCGHISAEKYGGLVREVLLFLDGRNSELVSYLQEKMESAADALRFEEAARIRDQILAVEQTLERQKAVSHAAADQDVFSFYREGYAWEFQVLFFRRGMLVGNKSLHFSRLALSEEEAVSAFLRQYYAEDKYIPEEILVPLEMEDRSLIQEWLNERRGSRAEILVPQRGPKKHLIDLARKNAEDAFRKRVDDQESVELTLRELREKLRLPVLPRRIECFDISNLFGTLAVASMVTFLDGQPDKSRYRRFKVQAPAFPDDYGMMYEVLQRRYGKLEPGEEPPDLLVVDGGKGQLNVALSVLRDSHLSGIAAIGLAKDRDLPFTKQGKNTADKIYLPNVKDPVLLPGHSPSLRYLQKIRDEAHRFAVTYHKKLRGRYGLQTMLNEVPGIGPVKCKALLKEFGTLQKIQEATIETLAGVNPLTNLDARNIFGFFHHGREA